MAVTSTFEPSSDAIYDDIEELLRVELEVPSYLDVKIAEIVEVW